MSLGVDDGQYEQYSAELSRVEQAFGISDDLRDLWLNPANSREKRLAGLDSLTGPLELSPTVVNTLRLLIERQRMGDLGDIAKAYRTLCDERAGRMQAVVTTAVAISDQTSGRIGEVLAGLTKKQIVLETKVDPGLIGGVVAQVGTTVFDGSLKTQLDLLRDSMKNARLQ